MIEMDLHEKGTSLGLNKHGLPKRFKRPGAGLRRETLLSVVSAAHANCLVSNLHLFEDDKSGVVHLSEKNNFTCKQLLRIMGS